MSWISIPPDDASPEVARVVRGFTAAPRPVPAVIAPMKHNPRALRAVMQMNSAVTFGGSSLGRMREELVATTVSALNDCFY